MPKELLLKCFLYGDESQSVFPVQILENDTVGILKGVIKKKKIKSNSFDASALVLYKGNILFDDDLGKSAASILDNSTPLLVSTEISDIFEGEPPDGSVHIIVQLPSGPAPRLKKRPRVSSTHAADSEDSDANTYTDSSSQYYVENFGFEKLRYGHDGRGTDTILDWHKNFWGKPLPLEHTSIKHGNVNSDLSPDSHSDESGDGDGENDDLLPENPAAILDMGHRMLLIRADYLRVYEYVEEIYNRERTRQCQQPAVVVTGQPGIGKTYWAYYVLRRRLGEAAEVLWYQASRLYLFCSEGVLEVPADFSYANFGSRNGQCLWTLIDSAVAPNGIPLAMNMILAGIYPIYITYPKQTSWSSMHKRWSFHLVLMNPWSRAEITYTAKILHPEMDISEVLQRYDSLGPTPRLCLDYGEHQIALHMGNRKVANFAYGLEGIETLFRKLLSESRTLSMGFGTETICLVQRVQGCPLSDPRFTVSPISNDVANKLALCLDTTDEEGLLEMWKTFSYSRDERRMTDLILEAYVQRRFRRQIDIQASPMHRLQYVNSRWHASFDTNLHSSAGKSSQGSFSLQIGVVQTVAYIRATSMAVKPNIYYIPQSGQQVGLNSFIVHGGILYMFQCTGCEDHGIKDGVIEFLASCQGVPNRNNWRFVFIVPDDLESFSCPASANPTIMGLQLHTARIPVTDSES